MNYSFLYLHKSFHFFFPKMNLNEWMRNNFRVRNMPITLNFESPGSLVFAVYNKYMRLTLYKGILSFTHPSVTELPSI